MRRFLKPAGARKKSEPPLSDNNPKTAADVTEKAVKVQPSYSPFPPTPLTPIAEPRPRVIRVPRGRLQSTNHSNVLIRNDPIAKDIIDLPSMAYFEPQISRIVRSRAPPATESVAVDVTKNTVPEKWCTYRDHGPEYDESDDDDEACSASRDKSTTMNIFDLYCHQSPASSSYTIELCQRFAQIDINAPPSYFLNLPLELREMVYDAVFEDMPAIHTVDVATKTCPGSLPAICFTSKRVWLEAVTTYLRRTNLVVSRNERDRNSRLQTALMTWLCSFPHSQGFQSIRTLTIQGSKRFRDYNCNSEWEPEYPHGLISRCPALRNLVLDVDSIQPDYN